MWTYGVLEAENQIRQVMKLLLQMISTTLSLLEIRRKRRPEDFAECKQIGNLQGKPLEESR
jgi:hypothetical protein